MRSTFFLFLTLIATASALGPADDKELAAIRTHLSNGRHMQILIQDLENKLPDAVDLSDMRALKSRISSLKNQRNLEFTKAVHLALVAYDILPTNVYGRAQAPSGTIVVPGRFKGKTSTWVVIAGDRISRTAQSTKGKPVSLTAAGSKAQGTTDLDGVSTLFPEAFESPHKLASTLYHELVHFEQITTPGVGDKLSRAEWDLAAYQAELGAVRHWGLDEEQSRQLKEDLLRMVSRKREEVEAERLKRKRSFGLWRPAYTDEPLHRSAEEVSKILKQAEELRDKVTAENRLRHLTRLREFAVKFCYDSWGVSQSDLDALNYHPAAYYSGMSPDLADLTPCQRELLALILRQLAARGKPALKELRSEAGRHAPGPESAPGGPVPDRPANKKRASQPAVIPSEKDPTVEPAEPENKPQPGGGSSGGSSGSGGGRQNRGVQWKPFKSPTYDNGRKKF